MGKEEEDQGDDEDAELSDRRVTDAVKLFAGAGVMVEVLPEAAAVITAGGELPWKALRLGAAALVTLPTEEELGVGQARSQMLGARAHACLGAGVFARVLDVEGCGGVAGGVVIAKGDGYPRRGEATLGWAAIALRASLRYPASSPFSLRFAVDGLLNVVRPELQAEGTMLATSGPGVVGGAAALELVIALP